MYEGEYGGYWIKETLGYLRISLRGKKRERERKIRQKRQSKNE